MKNMNLIQNENQRLKNDKNNLIKKISLIENEFKKNKEGFNIEIEKKNNNIMILKKEIMKLNILLNKKKDEVNDLKNKIIFNKGSEIKTLDDKMDGINNIIKENLNINEIINQNNSLKVQLENCQNQIVNIIPGTTRKSIVTLAPMMTLEHLLMRRMLLVSVSCWMQFLIIQDRTIRCG
jgi:chromosome segregation ATPase